MLRIATRSAASQRTLQASCKTRDLALRFAWSNVARAQPALEPGRALLPRAARSGNHLMQHLMLHQMIPRSASLRQRSAARLERRVLTGASRARMPAGRRGLAYFLLKVRLSLLLIRASQRVKSEGPKI